VPGVAGSPGPRRRPPLELIAVAVLTYIAGFLSVGAGILLILARYVTDIRALGGPFGVTLLGSFVVLFGLFVIAIASALTRGKHYARVATTIALAVEIVLAVVVLLGGDVSLWEGLALIVVAVLILVVLWLGRTHRYFLRMRHRDAAARRSL
jgi:hypothetical protein